MMSYVFNNSLQRYLKKMNFFNGIKYNIRGLLLGIKTPRLLLLGIARFAILFVISANGGSVTPSLISNWMLREPHTISSIISRMEKQGLVEKTRKIGGNVEIIITLTEKGRQIYGKISNIESIREMLSCLPEEEREQLSLSLKKLRDKGLSHLLLQKITFP